MSKTNPGNRLKCKTAGHAGWMPLKFGRGKGADGKIRTVEGYKNVLTDQEYIPPGGHNDAPPGPTGDLACVRHNSEAYRQGWERIWGENG
jgi:hypothetical protein